MQWNNSVFIFFKQLRFLRFISGAHLQHGGGNRVCRVRIVHSYQNTSVSARAIHMFAWPDDSTLAYIVLHVNTVLLRTFVFLDVCFSRAASALALCLSAVKTQRKRGFDVRSKQGDGFPVLPSQHLCWLVSVCFTLVCMALIKIVRLVLLENIPHTDTVTESGSWCWSCLDPMILSVTLTGPLLA